MRNQNRITPAQARQLMQQRAILWDVRTPAEYAAGHIPSARNVPLDRLDLGSINCWDGPLTR